MLIYQLKTIGYINMIEVERKYLVKNNSYKMQAQRAGLIVQGYLGDNPLSETRIAIRDRKSVV